MTAPGWLIESAGFNQPYSILRTGTLPTAPRVRAARRARPRRRRRSGNHPSVRTDCAPAEADLKAFTNRGIRSPLYFWRDRTGHEVDLVIDDGTRLLSVEIKASLTLGGAVYDWPGLVPRSRRPRGRLWRHWYIEGEESYPAARPHRPAVARVHLTARSAPWTELGRT